MANSNKSFQALVRKLHAAELEHLRQVVAEQQALLETQAAEIEDLKRATSWAEGRADMFQDLAHELQNAHPGVAVGLTMGGCMGVLQ